MDKTDDKLERARRLLDGGEPTLEELGRAVALSPAHLQRRFRDAHVATQHIATASSVYELVGRVALGLPTDLAML